MALNFKLLKIGLLVVLLVGLYFFFQGGATFMTNKPSMPPTIKTEAPAPLPPAKQQTVTTAAESPSSGTVELSTESYHTQSAPQNNSDLSYSLKRENKERQITPGVTFVPGQGISIKTDNKDETVQLQRDHTYNGDYQVMWKKKY